MQKEVRQTWHFNQVPQEVWEYLTRSELLEKWLMKNDFLPIVGHKFQFRHTPTSTLTDKEKIHYCEVLEIVPCKRLSYSWKVEKGSIETTINSIVVWTLSPKDGGTELSLLHNGFTLIEDANGHSKGWNICLDRMIELLNTSSNANTNS